MTYTDFVDMFCALLIAAGMLYVLWLIIRPSRKRR